MATGLLPDHGYNPWSAARSLPRPTPPDAAGTYSLDSLLLFVSLVAVCLAIERVSPGCAALFAVLAVPAIFFTAKALRHRDAAKTTGLAKARLFVLAWLAAAASLLCGGAICVGTFWSVVVVGDLILIDRSGVFPPHYYYIIYIVAICGVASAPILGFIAATGIWRALTKEIR